MGLVGRWEASEQSRGGEGGQEPASLGEEKGQDTAGSRAEV